MASDRVCVVFRWILKHSEGWLEDIPDCRGIRCVITERRWGEDPSGVRNVVRECAVLSETSKGEKKLLSLQIALWALEKYLFITGRAQGLCESGSEMIFLSSIGHGHIEWPCGGGGGRWRRDSAAWDSLHRVLCISLMGDLCPILTQWWLSEPHTDDLRMKWT